MRMISQAVAALLKAFGLRKAGQYEEAHQTINQVLEGLTGLRADVLERLDDQALVKTITTNEQIDLERARLLADLFHEQGNLYEEQKQAIPARSSYQRALMLSLEIAFSEGPGNHDQLKNTIATLVHLLPGDLPFDLSFSLFSYYEFTGDYHQAERILQGMLDQGQYYRELEQELKEFRQRMIEKSDQELIDGGFNRNEIAQLRKRV